MNRPELADLLAQPQSMMASSRAPTGSYHQPSDSVSEPPLSPRQRFQSHVRTLKDDASSPPRNASPTSRRPPQLQHVSSLRVQRGESPSPISSARLSPTWMFSESALETFSDGPQFMPAEREVWGKPPSPLRHTKSFTSEALYPQQPHEQSPEHQPHRHLRRLRPFAPLAQPVDINDRPKTSRGPQLGESCVPFESGADSLQQEQDPSLRPSKFAEGSMNDRSAGVSSTWNEHGSLASISGTDGSDNDITPRASPQRSSIDVNEFNPEPVAAPTFA